MKKLAVVSLVIIIAAMSVIAVSAAPRGGYYDQIGNKYWCNSDSYGCWVTGEDGGHEYIMFWSEAAATAIMGPNSGAPVGTLPGTSTMNLAAPVAEAVASAEKKDSDGGGSTGCKDDSECGKDQKCEDGKCVAKSGGTDPECSDDNPCQSGYKCESGNCVEDQSSQQVCDETGKSACEGSWLGYPDCRCETDD